MSMRKEDAGFIVEGIEHERFTSLLAAESRALELTKSDGQPCFIAKIIARAKPKFVTEVTVEYFNG